MDNSKQTYGDVIIKDSKGRGIYAKTKGQQILVEAIDDFDITFVYGPPGTGKSFLAMAKAIQYLQNKQFERIILTRPAVESGESLGFLPGELNDKIAPYMKPLYDFLEQFAKPGKKAPSEQHEHFDEISKKGSRRAKKDRSSHSTGEAKPTAIKLTDSIEVRPLAYMRGCTFNNCLVLADECQNITKPQMKMLLSRMGQNSKMILTGDEKQSDLRLRNGEYSGFEDAIERLYGIDGIGFVEMLEEDIVRHRLVREIIRAYDNGRVN